MTLKHSFVKRLDALPERTRLPATALWTLFQDLVRCDLLKQASAMAYVSLLSLVPSLVAVFCILSLFAPLIAERGDLVGELRAFILNNLAASSGETAVTYLDNMLASLDLRKIGWSSFASVLVTLILLLRQIEEALNRIWLINKGRNVFTRFMYFWTFLTLGTVVVAILLGVTAGHDLKRLLSFDDSAVTSSQGPLGSLVGLTGGFLFFFFLYKIVPNCLVRAKHAAAGAAMSSVMLSVASWGYGTFIVTGENYTTLYGALAQLPLFLMWLYICWIIILLGALLSWRLQEGFPRYQTEDTLDNVNSPAEALRNTQIKAAMPLITLIGIYRQYQKASGKGLSGQAIAEGLRLPVAWVADALDALQHLGYVVAARPDGDDGDGAASVADPYFPALPAESLSLAKVRADLGSPLADWAKTWRHELPPDIPKVLDLMQASPRDQSASLAEALRH